MSVPLLFLAAALASGAPLKVSVEGCVATGAEVGRKADLREKTGLDEHFVLVGAKVVKGKGPLVATSGPAAAPVAMYKISGLTDEQVKIHVGYRVRIEGSFGDLEQPSATVTPQDNLIELNVATIRQVPGTCALPKN